MENMSNYNRELPSVDVYLNEIPEQGLFRVRIVGTIVSVLPAQIIVNDGTGQVNLALSMHEKNQFEVQNLGRFIAAIRNENDSLTGTLIGWNPISADQAKRYRRIIKLERRIR